MILDITLEDKIKYFKNNSKEGIIYKIKNSLNNDFYIGSTGNLKKRYYTHLNDIRSNKNTCIKLIRSVNKYGEQNFIFEIIEKCNINELLTREQYYLDILNPKYNISKIAGSNLGIKRTKETKLKKSISQKENWKKEEYREKHLKELSKNWKKGSLHKMAKLTEEDVKKVKIKLNEGFSPKEISECLNLSYHSIKDIKRGKTWKHVEI
jgi:group I intron endonuclease